MNENDKAVSHANKKRIAKNTIYLYVRTFLIMCINLYASRLLLRELGEEDFGVYSVVGGVVVLFSFLNVAMVIATQRYLNFAMGKNDGALVEKTFNLSLVLHGAISLIALVLSETIALWFFNAKIDIPENSKFAANIVYQFSVFATIIGILTVPYNALVIATERMKFLALSGVLNALLKLGSTALLVFLASQKIIYYSLFIFLSSAAILAINICFCKVNFREIRYKFTWDREFFKEITSFAIWNLMDSISSIIKIQGLNVLLNTFFGVVINTAFGLAMQAGGAASTFIANFQTAFRPQIVKYWTGGKHALFVENIFWASKFSFVLGAIVTLPFLINSSYVLSLWLGNFPEMTPPFLVLILLSSMVDLISAPISMGMSAFGRIRLYQLVALLANSSVILLAYLWLNLGFRAVDVFYIKILMGLFLMLFRIVYGSRKLGFSALGFFYSCVFKTTFAFALAWCAVEFSFAKAGDPVRLFFGSSAAIALFLILTFAMLEPSERQSITALIKSKIPASISRR